MGYTHYWRKERELPQDKWNEFIKDVNDVFFKADDNICQEYDEPNMPPLATDNVVRFNGVDDNGHETFWFDRTESRPPGRDGLCFNFCKTARKPYDRYVVDCLKLAKKHFGKAVVLSSDGGDEIFD